MAPACGRVRLSDTRSRDQPSISCASWRPDHHVRKEMMMEHCTDRVAIITGASRGIGAGLVEAYCKIGYQVIANSRTIGESNRPEIFTVAGDIADPATSERLVAVAVSRFGRIDT